MDIVRFKGGLGNQMFQYAFLKALTMQGRNVKASIGFYDKHPELMKYCLGRVFDNIHLEYIPEEEFDAIDSKWKLIKQNDSELEKFKKDYKNRFFWVEEFSGVYFSDVFNTINCTFIGYWQTEKYFKDIRKELLFDFSFSFGDNKLGKIKKELMGNKSYVSVHIRRGDYLELPDVFENLISNGYYIKAMQYIEKKIENPIYVYFSDNIQWVKENFKDDNGIFIEDKMFDKYENWYDMCLMSVCSHNIIANSTFSWWGAWLNQNEDKIVVAPQQWFCDGRKPSDICPEEWIRI